MSSAVAKTHPDRSGRIGRRVPRVAQHRLDRSVEPRQWQTLHKCPYATRSVFLRQASIQTPRRPLHLVPDRPEEPYVLGARRAEASAPEGSGRHWLRGYRLWQVEQGLFAHGSLPARFAYSSLFAPSWQAPQSIYSQALSLTFGEQGESAEFWRQNPDATLDQAKEARRKESSAAAAILGAEVRFKDWGDYPLIIGRERLGGVAGGGRGW